MVVTREFADKRSGPIIGSPLFLSGHHYVSLAHRLSFAAFDRRDERVEALSNAMELDLQSSVLRMVAAVAFGGAIGLNRDIYGKPTGIRAHALVSLGAALLVLAIDSAYASKEHLDAMSRVIQGVIAGIGFLGAGVILRGSQGLQVYHLVTAASLWATTGVGILCGLGLWKLAGLATALVLIVLWVGQPLDRRLFGLSSRKDDDRV